MHRLLALLIACGASVAVYLCVFGFLVARPFVVDDVGEMMNYKLAYAREADSPKIFVIAGSNARFSHSCAVIEARLHRSCINAGIAAGIGMDWVVDNFRQYLRPGDVVYLPLEYGQYSVTRAAMLTSADAAYRFRHHKLSLLARGPDGLVRAAFLFDLPVLIHSLGEMTLHAAGGHRSGGVQTLNKQGDEVGHTDAQAKIYEPAELANPLGQSPRATSGTRGISRVVSGKRSGRRGRASYHVCRPAHRRQQRGPAERFLCPPRRRIRGTFQSQPISARGFFRYAPPLTRARPDRAFRNGGRSAGPIPAQPLAWISRTIFT